MSERKESISKIVKAFENNQLGFQKGAKNCRYYDKASDSCCAVGVLLDLNELPKNPNGDINIPFKGIAYSTIHDAMKNYDMSEFKGLSIHELEKLQDLHDEIITGESAFNYEHINSFKDYLYSLK